MPFAQRLSPCAAVLRCVRSASLAGRSVRRPRAARQDDEDDNACSIEPKFFERRRRGIGLQRDEPPIEYRERSPLVVPPTRDLPPPQAKARAAQSGLAERSRIGQPRKERATPSKTEAARRQSARRTRQPGADAGRARPKAGRQAGGRPGARSPDHGPDRRAIELAKPNSATRQGCLLERSMLWTRHKTEVVHIHARAAAHQPDRSRRPATRRRRRHSPTASSAAARNSRRSRTIPTQLSREPLI